MNEHFADKASKFITEHKDEPFFLYYATPNIHVPRTPNKNLQEKVEWGRVVMLFWNWIIA